MAMDVDLLGVAVAKWFEVRAKIARGLSRKTFAEYPAANALHLDGAVVLRGFIPVNLIDAINSLNERYFNFSDPSELVYSADGKYLREVKGVSRKDAEQFYFLHLKNYHRKYNVYDFIIPAISSALESYYRSNCYVRDVCCYRTQPIPSVQGSYQWHVDNYPAGSLKVIVYLTDVTQETGPLKVALGSHIGFQPVLGGIGERFEEEYVHRHFNIMDCLGPRGTVIIFNNNMIHRATDPVSGHRDVINFSVFPCVWSGRGGMRGVDLQETGRFLRKYTR